jgi:hypothetical protein
MSDVAIKSPPLRPAAPVPRKVPLGTFGRIAAMRRNPIEIWAEVHYRQPVLVRRTLLGERALVSDPAAVRHVLLDNVANYRKDDLQLRLLRPGREIANLPGCKQGSKSATLRPPILAFSRQKPIAEPRTQQA